MVNRNLRGGRTDAGFQTEWQPVLLRLLRPSVQEGWAEKMERGEKEDGDRPRKMSWIVLGRKTLTNSGQILPFPLWSRLLRRSPVREGWAGNAAEIAPNLSP